MLRIGAAKTLVAAALAAAVVVGQTSKLKAPKRSSKVARPVAKPSQTAKGKASKSKSAAQKKSRTRTAARSRAKPRSVQARQPARPRGQMRPTPERYKEIEEALAARGYLNEEPTGQWGQSSVEALRAFQADNQLPPTGKLDALSLIQLGLGPRQ